MNRINQSTRLNTKPRIWYSCCCCCFFLFFFFIMLIIQPLRMEICSLFMLRLFVRLTPAWYIKNYSPKVLNGIAIGRETTFFFPRSDPPQISWISSRAVFTARLILSTIVPKPAPRFFIQNLSIVKSSINGKNWCNRGKKSFIIITRERG